MRIYTNKKRAKQHQRRKYISLLANTAVLLMVLFAILLMLLFQLLPALATSPALLILMGILSAAIGLLAGNRLSNLPAPQNEIERELKGLDNSFTLLHYFLPADHVLIAPSGIYTLTPISHHGSITLDDTTVRHQRTALQRFLDILTQTGIGQPLKHTTQTTERTQQVIQNYLESAELEITPLIVFTNNDIDVTSDTSTFTTLFVGNRKPSLKSFLRTQPANSTLTQQQLDLLLKHLSAE